MKAINEELERIIKLNGITKRENILYGSNEAKVTGVSPTLVELRQILTVCSISSFTLTREG